MKNVTQHLSQSSFLVWHGYGELYHLPGTPMSHKASKTETLDLCQLPRPPFEIHKMINLPASVKISYFHLPHQAKKNDKLKKVIFELPHGILDCDFNSLHAWTMFFTFSYTNLTNFEN